MKGQRPDQQGDHINVGQVVGPHGIRGGLRVKPLTEFRERFDAGNEVILQGVSRVIVHSSWHKDQVRLRLRGLNDRTEAENLKWQYLAVPKDQMPTLAEDEFYSRDLVGMNVLHINGQELGAVTDVFPTPAHDVIVIGDAMVPAIREFVKEINMESRTMIIEPIDGMFESEENSS